MFRRALLSLTLFTLLLAVAAAAAAQDEPVPFVSFEYLQGPPLEGRLLFDSLEFNDITMGRAPATGNDRFIVEVDSATGEILRQLNAPVAAGNFQWHEQGYYSYSFAPPLVMLQAQARVRAGESPLVALLNATHIIADSDFNEILRIGGIDMPLDPHEVTFLPNGNFVFFSTEWMDIPDDFHRCIQPPCVLLYQNMHEMTLEGDLVRTWNLLDYYAPDDLPPSLNSDEYQPRARGIAGAPEVVDHTHMNAVTLAPDGDLLLSSRQFSDVLRIDYETGSVVWRIGGPSDPYSEFTFIDDPFSGFSNQHLPHLLPNGNLLLYDNGNARGGFTRAVEYALDVDNRTATLVWSYAPPEGDYFAETRGSAQRLPDGNTLINWVDRNPNIEIVTPQGDVVLQITLPEEHSSYRALYYPPQP